MFRPGPGLALGRPLTARHGRRPKPQSSSPGNIPAPIGGINAQDNLLTMRREDAIVLKNWIPQPYGCAVRGGRTLMSYNAPTPLKTVVSHPTSDALYTFTDSAMYDVTLQVDISAETPLVTGLADGSWYFVPFTNQAGSWMVGVNANTDDEPIVIDDQGTVTRLTRAADDGNPGAWEIANVNPQQFSHVVVHQRRLWFVEEGTSKGWYLAPDAVSGAATLFDFGPVFTRRGGNLFVLGTWSSDNAEGADDDLVAVSTNGDAVRYQGTDPNTSYTWKLQGTYYVGALGNRRCIQKIGGDLFFLGEEGAVPFSSLLITGYPLGENAARYNQGVQKLKYRLARIIRQKKGDWRWDIFYAPDINQIIFNCPPSSDTAAALGDAFEVYQHTMSTILGSWGEMNQLQGNHWVRHVNRTVFCSDSAIYTYGVQFVDDGLTPSDPPVDIVTDVMTAFGDLSVPGAQKIATMARPVFLAGGRPRTALELRADYDLSGIFLDTSGVPVLEGALWNAAKWNQSFWSGGQATYQEWFTAGAVGSVIGLRMKNEVRRETLWAHVDLVGEAGGVL